MKPSDWGAVNQDVSAAARMLAGQEEEREWGSPYLEDHLRTCKWLVTMVIVSPLNGVIPLINGLNGL